MGQNQGIEHFSGTNIKAHAIGPHESKFQFFPGQSSALTGVALCCLESMKKSEEFMVYVLINIKEPVK
jgi:hypothetical protein